MNRKQLEIQNASFLAELERKAKEIEILNIRLEDAEQKAEALANEKTLAENLAEELKAQNAELNDKISALELALAAAVAKNEQTEVLATAPQEVSTPTEEVTKTEEEVAVEEVKPVEETSKAEEAVETEVAPPLTEIDIEIEKQIEQVAALAGGAEFADVEPEVEIETETEETTPEAVEEPKAEENAPAIIFDTPKDEGESTDNFLRNYGAKIIARVTVATAEVMAKAVNSNDDVSKSLKTLALGKNESFKYQIMELSRQKQDPQKAVQEMDLLAEETIVYLKSI
jgi:hypothetical protein